MPTSFLVIYRLYNNPQESAMLRCNINGINSILSLASYRKFHYVETTVSTSCKYTSIIVSFADLHTVVPGENIC